MKKKLFIGISMIFLFSLMGILSYAVVYSSRDEAINAYNTKLTELNINCSDIPLTLKPVYQNDGNLWVCNLNNKCKAEYTWSIPHLQYVMGKTHMNGQFEGTYGDLPTLQEAAQQVRDELEPITEEVCLAGLEKLREQYTFTTN